MSCSEVFFLLAGIGLLAGLGYGLLKVRRRLAATEDHLARLETRLRELSRQVSPAPPEGASAMALPGTARSDSAGPTPPAHDGIPRDTAPGDPRPGETVFGDTAPGDTLPGETVFGDTVPGETGPGESGPGDARDGRAADGAVPGSPPGRPSALPPPAAEPPPLPAQSARPAGEAPPADSGPPDPPRPKPRIEWEQWIGRGAAILGGVLLALAGVMFLRYAVARGLIPPVVRVAIGLVTGVGAIVGSEWLRKRSYTMPANALAGAGIVVLYAAVWAGAILYQLIPNAVGYLLMVLVTVACGFLAWRHESLVVALLGLVGGFATPLLLSSGRDNPIGLFAYILLLDAGLLVLARRRRWPLLVPLSLAGTVLYQALWIFLRMDAERALLGLVVLGLFGLTYAFQGAFRRGGAPAPGEAPEEGTARATRVAGLLLPFLFALYFALRSDLGQRLVPLAALLLVLSLAALWLGRARQWYFLGNAAAAGAVAVVWVWCLDARYDVAVAWKLTAVVVVLAAAFHLFLEWGGRKESAPAAAVAAVGLFTPLVVFAAEIAQPSLWPWLAGWLLLAGLLIRQSAIGGHAYLQVVAAVGLALGFLVFFLTHGGRPTFPSPIVYFGLALATAVGLQAVAILRRDGGRRAAELASAAMPLLLLVGLSLDLADPSLSPALYLVTTLALAVLASLAATRLPSGPVYLVAMLALALAHWLWTTAQPALAETPRTALLGLLLQALAAALFTLWPLVTGRGFGDDRWTLYAAALAGPAWFPSLTALFEARFGDSLIAVVPVLLGMLSIAAALGARRRWPPANDQRRRGLAWFFAVALGFLSVAIPLQLEKEWITLGWALEGLAVLALWKRLDHAGLKYFGLALFGAATVRLVANPALLGYYPRSGWRVVNWLMYTYLVPAAAMVGGARILGELEVARYRDRELPLFGQRPVGSILCAVAAIVVTFVWINLTIFDFFSSGTELRISFDRLQARDLALSIAWALYALLLLVIGIARRSVGLRGIALAFLTLAIFKGFLYDLGELTDLYRVAALVGLAVSLFGVSLLYYRFVFRAGSKDPGASP